MENIFGIDFNLEFISELILKFKLDNITLVGNDGEILSIPIVQFTDSDSDIKNMSNEEIVVKYYKNKIPKSSIVINIFCSKNLKTHDMYILNSEGVVIDCDTLEEVKKV